MASRILGIDILIIHGGGGGCGRGTRSQKPGFYF